jgi:hypothetical protein
MLTERTLIQLLSQKAPADAEPDRARELGRLGYMQWLGGLPSDLPYPHEAARALRMAHPFASASAPVAEFCGLLAASLVQPLTPLDLDLPPPRRRGGTRMRRLSL